MILLSCVLLVICTVKAGFTKTLNPKDILQTTAQFYPDILGGLQKIQASKTRIDKAEGAFDSVLSQDLYTRPDGYYDGALLDTRIAQPVKEWNANVYTGYRVGNGIFPIYENERETNDSGEYYIGAKLSLLRDRMINKKTATLSITELNLIEEKTNLVLQKLAVQKEAVQKYWSWVTAGHQYDAYKNLLELATTRQKNLAEQVKQGNIASIYLQENKQYLLKRQADLNMAEANMAIVAQELSLYYRDKNGQTIVPSVAMLPQNMAEFFNHTTTEHILNDVSEHPVFTLLKTQKNILEQKKSLSENDLLPYLDFNVKASQDLGNGSKTRDEGDLVVYLNMTVPLDRTVAKSDKAFAEAKLQELTYKEQMQRDKLCMAVKNLLINMNNQKQYLAVTKQEYELAEQMTHVEEQRVQAGISDFFTLNKREEEMLKIQIQRLKAQENYLKMHAEIKNLTASLEPEFKNILD